MLKLLRTVLVMSGVFLAVGGAYVVVPFWTAWTIREAVRENDSAYLEQKIEWNSVRATLKESLGKFAFTASGEISELPEKPSVWQRIKSYVGQGAVDRFVDTTITPTGMAGLFKMRKAYQDNISGEDPSKRPSMFERMHQVWSRVSRAEFAHFDRFEMDMVDKASPERTINCVLERRGWQWKMTELRVKPTDKARLASIQPVAALR